MGYLGHALPPRPSHTLVVTPARRLVTAALLLCLTATAQPTAAAPQRSGLSAGPGGSVAAADDDGVLEVAGLDGRAVLHDDVVQHDARRGVAAKIRKWPGRTIPYYESIPAKWDWSLDQAFDHWNRSGGKIKFVEVPKSKAKLFIQYGYTGGADGVGTLGYGSRNYVNLSPAYKKTDEKVAETRVWVGRLFAHELGHVLGFSHTQAKCSLMVPVFVFGVCPVLAEDKPGYYACRWIDKKLLNHFIRMYGGKAKRSPAACLIEALPEPLRDVRFSGGNAESKPVTVTWTPPKSVRDGTKLRLTVWRGTSCAAVPDTFDLRVGLDPRAGKWTDPTFGEGTWCYHVQIENRYGGTRPAHTAALPRYRPVPGTPAVGTPTFHAAHGGWHVAWTPPWPGAHLEAVRNPADPEVCLTDYDMWEAETLEAHGAGTYLLEARAPEECVTFYVLTDWNTMSPAAQRTLSVPAGATPSAPAIGPLTWNVDDGQFTSTWTPPHAYMSLRVMRPAFDDPTTCAPAYDEDQADWVGQGATATTWTLQAYDASECFRFYAVTNWGTHSAATEVLSQVPAPTATVSVGTVAPWTQDPSAASAVATLSSPAYLLGIEVLEGTCPAVVPAGLDWYDGYEDWDTPNLWYFYPEPWGSPSQQCVMFAAMEGFGQHGPVVKRQFTVAAP
jgi:hypothetical protein